MLMMRTMQKKADSRRDGIKDRQEVDMRWGRENEASERVRVAVLYKRRYCEIRAQDGAKRGCIVVRKF